MGGHTEEVRRDAVEAGNALAELIQEALPPGVAYVTIVFVPAKNGTDSLCVSNMNAPCAAVHAVRKWLEAQGGA